MKGLIATITSLTCPSPKEVAALAVVTIVGAAIATALIWGVDLGLTAGVSML